MIYDRTTFNLCEVIALCNVNLGDYSIVKVIGMRSIIVETIVRDKIDQIRIKDALNESKLHANLFSVSKLVLNNLKVQFNLKKILCKSLEL